MTDRFDAVILVSFGGPEGHDDVSPFLQNVTAGKDIPASRLAEVAQRYHRFGGASPINQANRDLLAALRVELDAAGNDVPLYWGNRNWHPLLDHTVRAMIQAGRRRALAIVTSAFGSYSGCRQYREDLDRAQATADGAIEITKVRPYWNHPGFITAMTDRVNVALATVSAEARPRTRLVFTAHSIPMSWTATAPYVGQLNQAAGHLASACAPDLGWDLAFQSRSGPPQVPWLEPDISDHLHSLAATGTETAIVVPLGFVSDHMEVVHDLDVEAKTTADQLGINMVRAQTAGTHSAFVAMLGQLISEHMNGTDPLATVGDPWPNPCPADCCPSDL